MKNVLFVFGTRPEAIKMAPVINEMKSRKGLLFAKTVVTAQHRQMLDQVLELFNLVPDYDLNLMTHAQTPDMVAAKILLELPKLLDEIRPSCVIVQGDTTTTFAAALAAFHNKMPVAHVEAGLRTGDMSAPFPEEMNRRLTTHITTWHFPPTEGSRKNLLKENILDSAILVTGNTVIDALLQVASRPYFFKDPLLANIKGRLMLITAHRRESFGEPFKRLCNAIRLIAESYPQDTIIYPVHLNPNVRKPVMSILNDLPNVNLIEPLSYEPFVHLMKKAYLILTDSGGIQEEAPSFGIPVLVMRDKTERPEGIDAGTVRLVGTDEEVIVSQVHRLMDDHEAYRAMSESKNPYGDGHASERIVNFLEQNLLK